MNANREQQRVRIGDHAISLASIAAIHWEGPKLFIHLDGGRFLQLVGEPAKLLWDAYLAGAVDLQTGEVMATTKGQ